MTQAAHIPYMGISGVRTRAQIDALLELAPQLDQRLLAFGVLVDFHSLYGEPRHHLLAGRHPTCQELATIFPRDPRAFYIAHYVTQHPRSLYAQLRFLLQSAPHTQAIQLLAPRLREAREQLKQFRTDFPGHRLILHIGQRAFVRTGYDPKRLSEKIHQLAELFTDCLLDFGAGYGRAVPPREVLRFLRPLQDLQSECNLGIADRLSARTVERRLKPLLKEFPLLSTDASRGVLWQTGVNIDMARRYILKSDQLFTRFQTVQTTT